MEDNRPRWVHRNGDEYLPVQMRIIGNPEAGYSDAYYAHGNPYPLLGMAIAAGFEMGECDDFGICAFRDGKLVARLWMDQVAEDVESDPSTMADIAEQLGVEL